MPNLRLGRRVSWNILTLTPGAHPAQSLAAPLARQINQGVDSIREVLRLVDVMGTDERAIEMAISLSLVGSQSLVRQLILVDQFEELFTLCRDDSERNSFLSNLLYACRVPSGRGIVVAGLRADFYGQALQRQELAPSCSGNPHLHGYFNFAEPLVETAPKLLHHSCGSELTRQGISLP